MDSLRRTVGDGSRHASPEWSQLSRAGLRLRSAATGLDFSPAGSDRYVVNIRSGGYRPTTVQALTSCASIAGSAVAGERPKDPGAVKPVRERESSPAVP